MESGLGAAAATGAIRQVRAGDLSITYDTGGAGADAGNGADGFAPPWALNIIDAYARRYA